ncbi:hypothetical protein BGW38_010393, partial [Lunasporangiospora selenospora]
MDVVLSTSVQSVPGPVGGLTCNLIGAPVAAAETTFPISVTSSNTYPLDTPPSPVSGIIASSTATPFNQVAIQVSRKACEAEVEQRFISLLTPEAQEAARASSNIYDYFAKILKDDHRESKLGERVQNIEAILIHNTKLQEEIHAYQKE